MIDMKDRTPREKRMGRLPKPATPMSRSLPIFPTPAPADYSDEVSKADIKKLETVAKKKDGDDGDDGDEWELVDGPGW